MRHERGDGSLRRLGDRRSVEPAAICPDCGRAGFHRATCSQPVPPAAPTRPATLDELRSIIREARRTAAA